jgi:RimJ/RimL family protein N-acetyltransferase
MTFDNYLLRLIEKKDRAAFFELISGNRSRINNYLPKTASANSDPESTAIYIDQKIMQAEAKENFCFVIEDKSTGKLSGAIFLKNFDWSVPKCELGYFIDREQEGKGVVSGSVKQIVNYCFNVLKLNKLFLRTATDNIGSRVVALKNGFVEEGILRKDFMTETGQLIDVIYYGLVRENLK